MELNLNGAYKSKDLNIKAALKARKAQTKIDNKGLKPYINVHYKCASCNNKHKSHPVTSYCFVCDSDNWTPDI